MEHSKKILKSDFNGQQTIGQSNESSDKDNCIKQNYESQPKTDTEMEALRNHMKSLEIEQLKMEMTVMELSFITQRMLFVVVVVVVFRTSCL